jgi:hypothetical protein
MFNRKSGKFCFLFGSAEADQEERLNSLFNRRFSFLLTRSSKTRGGKIGETVSIAISDSGPPFQNARPPPS